VPKDFENPEATPVGFEYRSRFLKNCTVGEVTFSYTWEITTKVHGTEKVLNIPQNKKFICAKVGGTWVCSRLIF
jgi:hypothetical protein